MTSNPSTHESPSPTWNTNPSLWKMVIEDMQARDEVGKQRYGTVLQAFNGRPALVDAYQEILDFTVYLRQHIEEQNKVKDSLTEVFDSAEVLEQSDKYQDALVLLQKIRQLKETVKNWG